VNSGPKGPPLPGEVPGAMQNLRKVRRARFGAHGKVADQQPFEQQPQRREVPFDGELGELAGRLGWQQGVVGGLARGLAGHNGDRAKRSTRGVHGGVICADKDHRRHREEYGNRNYLIIS